MQGGNLSGLIELLFVVALLLWFWRSLASPPRQGEDGSQDPDHRSATDEPPPPQT